MIFPDMLITAYSTSYFPMADEEDGKVYWHSPDPRAIFPLDVEYKIPRSLKQSIRKYNYTFGINQDFENVIQKCADRSDTWISEEIIDSYILLHKAGYAFSVETYYESNLCGGLYGVAIGGAFFGESMFNTMPDSSKAAYLFLRNRLKEQGFVLLDSQYINPFTESLGAIEIPKYVYLNMLKEAIKLNRSFI